MSAPTVARAPGVGADGGPGSASPAAAPRRLDGGWRPGRSAGADAARGVGAHLARLLRVVEVERPGVLTTVQDLPGRAGLWEFGVPPSGPMDADAFARATALVGNSAGAAGLEATLEGPAFRLPGGGVIAVCGAEAPVLVGGRTARRDTAIEVRPGELVDIGWAERGARIYVAVRGGLATDPYLGSRSTFVAGGFGGHEGRALRRGDRISVGHEVGGPVPGVGVPEGAAIPDVWELAVLHGPHGAPDVLSPAGLDTMLEATWTVGSMADRTGVRLEGASPAWARRTGGDAGLDPSNVTETPYALGAIMVAGSTPIIVGVDGPSLGGFAAPLCVARGDLHKVGQLRPGDRVRLVPATQGSRPARRLLPAVIAERRPAGDGSAIREGADAAPAVRYRRAGEANVVVEYGDPVTDLALRFRVHALARAVHEASIPGVLDLTPGMRCLQVRTDPTGISTDELVAALEEIESALPAAGDLEVPSREVTMPLCWNHPGAVEAMRRYAASVRPDAPWCPDNIEFIRRVNGLDSAAAVQRTVLDASYCVVGLGDVYLGAPVALPLDPRHQLVTTKYTPPRGWTPENAVGIGGSFLCIYGMEGPGGYQLFGRTVQVWNRAAQVGSVIEPGRVEGEPPWLLRHFDRIRFELVDEATLARLRDASAAGRSVVSIADGTLKLADRLALEAEHADEIAALRAERGAAMDAERTRWAA